MRQCSLCVMDETDPEITFDEKGVCNHCREFKSRADRELHTSLFDLSPILRKIKSGGQGKKYDCLIGLSGGVDSSYVAHCLIGLDVRPLAVSLDNGWDTELSKRNVEKLVKKHRIPHEVIRLDMNKFLDLQRAFLKANVINVEAPTDHVITSYLYRRASQEKIRWIITGGNVVTEAIMPKSWGYDARDWKHIKAINALYGSHDIDEFPHMTLVGWLYYTFIKRIKFFPILNYMNYNREQAKILLHNEFGWEDYGPKHFESIYTRFFQGYILPRKFGIDKRKAHLSTLINSGQMTKKQALIEMLKEYYPQGMMENDRNWITKKLGLDPGYFERYVRTPQVDYTFYPNNGMWFDRFRTFISFARKVAIAN